MIKAGIDHVNLLAAGRAHCPEELAVPDLIFKDRIQIRIDSCPYFKIVLAAAFRSFYSLNFFL